MLYFTCTTITSVDLANDGVSRAKDLAHYGVSRAKDWVSVDCGTNSFNLMRSSICFNK